MTRLEKILLAVTVVCLLLPRTETAVDAAPTFMLPGPSPSAAGETDELWVTLTTRIDINHAGASELTALPGIGGVTAQAIVDYREANGPFSGLEELLLVPGVKEATVRALMGENVPAP